MFGDSRSRDSSPNSASLPVANEARQKEPNANDEQVNDVSSPTPDQWALAPSDQAQLPTKRTAGRERPGWLAW